MDVELGLRQCLGLCPIEEKESALKGRLDAAAEESCNHGKDLATMKERSGVT